MRKTILLLLACSLAYLDVAAQTDPLIGKWKCISEMNGDSSITRTHDKDYQEYFEFLEHGEFKITHIVKQGSAKKTFQYSGKWKFLENSRTLIFFNGIYGPPFFNTNKYSNIDFQVSSLTESSMQLSGNFLLGGEKAKGVCYFEREK